MSVGAPYPNIQTAAAMLTLAPAPASANYRLLPIRSIGSVHLLRFCIIHSFPSTPMPREIALPGQRYSIGKTRNLESEIRIPVPDLSREYPPYQKPFVSHNCPFKHSSPVTAALHIPTRRPQLSGPIARACACPSLSEPLVHYFVCLLM